MGAENVKVPSFFRDQDFAIFRYYFFQCNLHTSFISIRFAEVIQSHLNRPAEEEALPQRKLHERLSQREGK